MSRVTFSGEIYELITGIFWVACDFRHADVVAQKAVEYMTNSGVVIVKRDEF